MLHCLRTIAPTTTNVRLFKSAFTDCACTRIFVVSRKYNLQRSKKPSIILLQYTSTVARMPMRKHTTKCGAFALKLDRGILWFYIGQRSCSIIACAKQLCRLVFLQWFPELESQRKEHSVGLKRNLLFLFFVSVKLFFSCLLYSAQRNEALCSYSYMYVHMYLFCNTKITLLLRYSIYSFHLFALNALLLCCQHFQLQPETSPQRFLFQNNTTKPTNTHI